MIWYVALEGKTGYTENIPFFFEDQRKVVKKTKTLRVEVTDQQLEALRRFLSGKDNKSAWIRAVLAQAYEKETGETFPPDPVVGNPELIKYRQE